MDDMTQRFIDALHQLEDSSDAGPIAALFNDDATVSNPLVKYTPGENAAKTFWDGYRAAFDKIHSEFRHVVKGDGVSILEWTSTGNSKGGDLNYGGTSVLEFDGAGISAFRTYFNPGEIGHQLVAER